MDNVHLPAIGSLIGTSAMVLIYIYLYVLYRDRSIGLWGLSWLILLSRYIVFDSGMLVWKQSILGLIIYQILTMISILLFVSGTYTFKNEPINKWWIYSIVSVTILTVMLNALFSSLVYKLLLPILFGSIACAWIGFTFIYHLKLKGFGHLITGYAYILWGFLNASMPFTVDSSWSSYGYAIGGILRLIIAIGTLIVYFEKTRADLISKETQYRLLAENAVDVIYHLRLLPEVKIEYISPSVLTITGYKPEEYYDDNHLIFSVIHPEDHSQLDRLISNLSNQNDLPSTLRLVRKDKSVVWTEQKCVPIYDENSNLVAIEGIIRDITMRKKLEQMSSLFDRMNMVGSMAATVAHEIRNPLTTVRGYLQVLAKKEKYQADKEKFNLMIEEIDRANAIIREYLSLSRSREKLINLKKCSLNHIIESLFPLIQANANSSKVYAKLDLADIPELFLDENEIRQLLLNLVRNGIEAMPAGGNLIVRTCLEGDKVVLAISDQGSGIPADILDALGTPFITTKDTGTGLGLPICYQIVRRHNASIRIDTGDEGTTFFIYFNLPVS